MEMKEVNLDCLRETERISIHTENSVYEFSVTDPASRTGILKGGSLGEIQVVASLLCYTSDNEFVRSPKLNVGARALFLCLSTKGARRLVTSQVRGLSYIQGRQSEINVSVA